MSGDVPEGTHWLRGFLRLLAEQGRTMPASSHVLAGVVQTVDGVVIIARGRVVRRDVTEPAPAGTLS